jgi:hypothetical protein
LNKNNKIVFRLLSTDDPLNQVQNQKEPIKKTDLAKLLKETPVRSSGKILVTTPAAAAAGCLQNRDPQTLELSLWHKLQNPKLKIATDSSTKLI